MILLESIRINVSGRFEFRLSSSEGIKSVAIDPKAAVLSLQLLGVRDAEALVAHSIEWGFIEILDPD